MTVWRSGIQHVTMKMHQNRAIIVWHCKRISLSQQYNCPADMDDQKYTVKTSNEKILTINRVIAKLSAQLVVKFN
jgi:hypothetical protein